MTMILAEEALVLGGLLLGLAAVAVAVQGLDHAPRCRDCKAATDVEEAEVLGHGPPVIAVTYRCRRCRCVVFRRYLGTWD
jgi:hypothetical protein